MKRSQNNSGFKDRSPLLIVGVALWVGAPSAGLLGFWALGLLLLLATRRLRFVGLVALTGLSLMALHSYSIHHAQISGREPFRLVVQSDPRSIESHIRGSYRTPTSFTFDATLLRFGEVSTHLPIRVFTTESHAFIPSQVLIGFGRFTQSRDRTIAGTLSVTSLQVEGEPNLLNRVAANLRAKFRSIAKSSDSFGADARGVVPGMVLGDTSLESASFLLAMKRSGLTHLTAVSGENFAIVSSALIWLLMWPLPRHMKLRNLLVGIGLACFIVLVRPSPSVLRSAVMTGVLLIARTRGSRSASLNALGVAIALLIVINPFQAESFSFALSVCATAGIILFSSQIKRWLSKYVRSELLAEAIAIPISATVFCTPIIVLLSGQVSLISLPANLAASLAVAPITIIGLCSALIAPLWGIGGQILFSATLPWSWWITHVAALSSKAPVLTLPANLVGIGMIAIVATIIYKRWWKFFFFLIFTFIGASLIGSHQWPGSDWQIVNCDVGQGDGSVIRVSQHEAIVIDVGPDPEAMEKCLHRLGINRIPVLVLTHFHADHVGGLAAVIHGLTVGEVWVSGADEPMGEYTSVMAELKGIPMRVVSRGDQFTVGRLKVNVLWPQSKRVALTRRADGSEINNESIALLIDAPTFSLFSGGDIETDAQMAIAEGGLIHQVDIFKVSHHGSRSQYLPLLDRLHPRKAFISVGTGNMYGHPAASLLAALAHRGIETFRTDKDGAIAFDSHLKARLLHRSRLTVGLH